MITVSCVLSQSYNSGLLWVMVVFYAVVWGIRIIIVKENYFQSTRIGFLSGAQTAVIYILSNMIGYERIPSDVFLIILEAFCVMDVVTSVMEFKFLC